MTLRAWCWAVCVALCACSGKHLSRDQMLDSSNCNACHVQHFNDWASSMHAYASDDPVFRAMNQRGQRETGGQLGGFCVQCHAPMAVHEGATTDGLNLDSVAQPLHGVSCYFCHSVDQVNGTHDNPLTLASDLVMRGELSDAISNTGHSSMYSANLDRDQLASAQMCGSCHDIVNGHGASIERTFQEWQASVFSQAVGGTTCDQCHMRQSSFTQPIAQYQGAPSRSFHAHTFEGVDVALTPFPDAGAQQALIEDFLGTRTLQSAVCVGQLPHLFVILDNVGAGHNWPSGSAQDRRAWVEVVAYGSDGGILYQSGVVPDGGEVTALNDPDLWLLRDCMFDENGNQCSMFWQAFGDAGTEGNELLAQQTFNQADPLFFTTHRIKVYPENGFISDMPVRVTARVRIQPIGMDVLDDLVDSGDLDAGYRDAMPVFTVGQTENLDWRLNDPDAGTPCFPSVTNCEEIISCVTNTSMNLFADKTPALVHSRCSP